MNNRVLFVDDDPNILNALQRNLRRDFAITTVSSPEAALQTLRSEPGFAAIVSDLKMPRITGIELLTVAAEKWPDTVRILLTAEADTKAAIAAVNHGHVYRFLMKPLALSPLSRILTEALKQHNLVVAERELLQRTLAGSMKVLTEMLCLLHPLAFSRTGQIQNTVRELIQGLGISDTWEFEVAAMLSLIGCIALPDKVLRKVWEGQELSPEDRRVFESHPAIGSRLLQAIPRFESICQMIELQEQPLPPLGTDVLANADRVLLGAHLLAMAHEFESLLAQGLEPGEVLDRMQKGSQPYAPALFASLAKVGTVSLVRESRTIKYRELSVGMVTQTDIESQNGLLLLAKGHTITTTTLEGLARHSVASGIREPIQVLLPDARSHLQHRTR